MKIKLIHLVLGIMMSSCLYQTSSYECLGPTCIDLDCQELAYCFSEALLQENKAQIRGLKFSGLRDTLNFFQLKDFDSLRCIYFIQNAFPMDEVLEGIRNKEMIEEVHIEQASISELPEALSLCKNLKKLSFDIRGLSTQYYSEKIRKVDFSSIKALENIEELTLWGNIDKIPSEISNFRKLRKFQIWDANELYDFSPIEDLAIEELLIRSTSLTKLPNEISTLDGLRSLSILKTGGPEVNDFKALSGLKNLEEIKIQCSLKQVPTSFMTLKSLKNLFIRHLEDPEMLWELKSLETLLIPCSDSIPLGIHKLQELREVWVCNDVLDLSPLLNLSKLESIKLCGRNSSRIIPNKLEDRVSYHCEIRGTNE
ncbi:MAG: hypothetical protein MRY83_12975 [Flavobacteriales bacterium]|nr:hypothetical protein [Flavobacteriales bacterium]